MRGTSNQRDGQSDRVPADLFGGAESLPSIIYSALRGRMMRTLLIAGLLALPLAILGWLSTSPMYESKGTVYVKPALSVTVNETHLNKAVGYYHDFVKAERERLNSGRVYAAAARDPRLRELGWPEGDAGRGELERIISVPVTHEGTIELVASHPRAEITEAAINAVLRAYMDERGESLASRALGMVEPRVEQERVLGIELDELKAQADPLYEKYGSAETIGVELKSVNDELVKFASMLREHRSELEQLDTKVERRSEMIAARRAGDSSAGPTRRQLALNDARMSKLEDQRSVLLARLDRAEADGLMISHPSLVAIQNNIELLDGLIEDRFEGLESQWWGAYEAEIDDMIAERSQLVRHISDDQKQEKVVAERRQGLLGRHQQVKEISERISVVQGKLTEVTDKREALEAEIEAGKSSEQLLHAEIIHWAELPSKHAKDSRVLRAIAGAVFAGLLALVGMVGFGQLNRRVRYIDEVGLKKLGVPCLGAIPVIGGDGADAASLEVYEMIDHVRGLLEVSDGPKGSSVLTVTSSGAGDGKSTVVRALAASFARAGQKTLLIDADPHGRAATRRFGAEGRPGLRDCLASPEVSGVIETAVEGLWLMPAGDKNGASPSLVSVERLVDDLREDFDRVLVDTGPIFGCVETNLFARCSDGVVLVVSRGQSRSEIDRALDRIGEIGSRCMGLIFNRADRADYIKSAASVSSMSRREPLELEHGSRRSDADRSQVRTAERRGIAAVYS